MIGLQVYRELYGEPRDGYLGAFEPTVAQPRAVVELIELRAVPRAVLALIREGNRLHLIEATHSDETALGVLGATDRARVASAVHAWQKVKGGADGRP